MSRNFVNQQTGQKYRAVSGWRPDTRPDTWVAQGQTLVCDVHRQEYALRRTPCGDRLSALDTLALEPHYKLIEEVK